MSNARAPKQKSSATGELTWYKICPSGNMPSSQKAETVEALPQQETEHQIVPVLAAKFRQPTSPCPA